jgi:hypothetical protein
MPTNNFYGSLYKPKGVTGTWGSDNTQKVTLPSVSIFSFTFSRS